MKFPYIYIDFQKNGWVLKGCQRWSFIETLLRWMSDNSESFTVKAGLKNFKIFQKMNCYETPLNQTTEQYSMDHTVVFFW